MTCKIQICLFLSAWSGNGETLNNLQKQAFSGLFDNKKSISPVQLLINFIVAIITSCFKKDLVNFSGPKRIANCKQCGTKLHFGPEKLINSTVFAAGGNNILELISNWNQKLIFC